MHVGVWIGLDRQCVRQRCIRLGGEFAGSAIFSHSADVRYFMRSKATVADDTLPSIHATTNTNTNTR